MKASILAPMSKYYPVPSGLENHNGIDGKSQKQTKVSDGYDRDIADMNS